MWKWKEIRQKKKKQWEIITIWKMRHRRKIHLSWLKNGYDYDLLLLYKRCAKTQVHAFLANRSHLFSFINEIVPFQLKLTHAAWGSGGGGGVRRPHPEEEKKPKLIKYLDAANEFRVHGLCNDDCSLPLALPFHSHVRVHHTATAADQTSKHDKSSDKLRCKKAMHFWIFFFFLSAIYLFPIFVVFVVWFFM